jgi:hypothetical protein
LAREILQVREREGIGGAAETAQPLQHIGRIAGLRHLAVIDDIDAGFDLFLHRLIDR